MWVSSDPICLKALNAVTSIDKPSQIARAKCILGSGGEITSVLPHCAVLSLLFAHILI